MRLGGIETGGTKIVCCIADENDNILDRYSYPTTDNPKETIEKAVEYFKDKNIEALGIASFGPLCLDPKNPKYGNILMTTKPGWNYVDMITPFVEAFNVPVEIDTDVNAPCLSEVNLGAAKGCDNAIYITIGTGIGVGAYINGKLVHGVGHPEAGHISLVRRKDDNGKSVCAYHKDCFEALASGPSIKERWGKPFQEIADRDDVCELEAHYIGQGIANYIMTYAPEKIVMGGGVMHVTKLYPLIRQEVKKAINGYLGYDILEDLDNYIVPCALGDNAGVLGAIELAKLALKK